MEKTPQKKVFQRRRFEDLNNKKRDINEVLQKLENWIRLCSDRKKQPHSSNQNQKLQVLGF